MNKKVELLAPAGNLEKLKYAISYGADAVYAGIPDFSLRVRINNFTPESIKEAVNFTHQKGKKFFVTLNIYAHNRHLEKLPEHLKFLRKLKIDGLIISDPGIIMLAKKYFPEAEIHLSTQANATNWQAVKFWKEQGVKRVILAREVTLAEIKEIKKKVKGIELECFVHGAMCMSYSGRCILSQWMTGRSANLGDCAQPCRWGYTTNYESDTNVLINSIKEEVKKMSVVDRQQKYNIDLEEDRQGTYFFNSRDLNLINHIGELIDAGIDSLKIEGRAKSVYYVAGVVRAYRKVLDAWKNNLPKDEIKKIISEQEKELNNLVNRGYTEGFLFGQSPEHNYSENTGSTKGAYKFVGEIEGEQDGLNIVKVHNEIFSTDFLEAVTPEETLKIKIKKIFNDKMEEMQEAHGGHNKKYFFEFDKLLPEGALLRKKNIL